MLNMISLVMSILSIFGMILGLVPCFGALNWLNIPFAAVTLVIGIVGYIRTPPYVDKKIPKLAILLSTVAIVIGMVRLMIGGGVV